MKRLTLPLALSLFVAALAFTGCASTGTTSTTQPNAAVVTTQAASALDVAVNVIHIGLDLHVITPATYWRDIDPVIVAAQASVKAMIADTNAGNLTGKQTASDAVFAALQKLQPYLQAVADRQAADLKVKAN